MRSPDKRLIVGLSVSAAIAAGGARRRDHRSQAQMPQRQLLDRAARRLDDERRHARRASRSRASSDSPTSSSPNERAAAARAKAKAKAPTFRHRPGGDGGRRPACRPATTAAATSVRASVSSSAPALRSAPASPSARSAQPARPAGAGRAAAVGRHARAAQRASTFRPATRTASSRTRWCWSSPAILPQPASRNCWRGIG